MTQDTDTLGPLLHRLESILKNKGDADSSKFVPRRFSHVTRLPGAVAAGNSIWCVDTARTPPAGKIWNIRSASLLSTDPTNGAVAFGSVGYVIAVGIPNQPDAAIQADANTNLDESLFADAIGGSNSGLLFNPTVDQSFSRYQYWVMPGEVVYGLGHNPGAASLAAGSDVILSYRVDEYDQDRIVYGEHSTNAILEFRESLFPPRQQA